MYSIFNVSSFYLNVAHGEEAAEDQAKSNGKQENIHILTPSLT